MVFRVLAVLLPVRAGELPLGLGLQMLPPLPHFTQSSFFCPLFVLWMPGGSLGCRPPCPAPHGTQFSSPQASGLPAFSFLCQGPFVVSVGLCPGRRSWEKCLQHPLLELEVHSVFSVKAGTLMAPQGSLADAGHTSRKKGGSEGGSAPEHPAMGQGPRPPDPLSCGAQSAKGYCDPGRAVQEALGCGHRRGAGRRLGGWHCSLEAFRTPPPCILGLTVPHQ